MSVLSPFPGLLSSSLAAPAFSPEVPLVPSFGEPASVVEQQWNLDTAYEFARLTGAENPQQAAATARIAFAMAEGAAPPRKGDPLGVRLQETLVKVFGHKRFQQGQLATIRAIMEGKDTFTIFPTGAGKSLCYQLPSVLFAPKLTIVVSPLIALMNDQVRGLVERGVPAACVHSNMKAAEQEAAYASVKSGATCLLYVSPEQLGSSRFFANVGSRDVALLTIDEAHCVSTWGHDFRPSYQLIRKTRATLGNPPIALITATAPPHTREDIKRVLGLSEVVENFRTALRPNLSLSIEAHATDDDKKARLLTLFPAKQKGSTIIYCATRRAVVEVSAHLKGHNVTHVSYHGQMDPFYKAKAEQEFLSDEAKVIVCTSAFGMGIDKPDVRRIVHYQVPGSIEDYYQQVGRAGRDGRPAEGILFFAEDDIRIQTGFVISSNPEAAFVRLVYERIKAFALKVPAFQGGQPATHAQLLKNAEAQFSSEERIKQMAIASFGMLVEHGYLGVDGDAVEFPNLEDLPPITDDLIREKRTRAYRKLDALLAYARTGGGESPMEYIRRYLDESTEETLNELPSTQEQIREKLHASLTTYEAASKQHAMLLSGSGKCSEEAKRHPLYRALAFLSQSEIETMLEALKAKGRAVLVSVSRNESVLRLTPEGEAYFKE